MNKKIYHQTLEYKENFAKKIIEKVLSGDYNTTATFTGGKDSLVMLHLIKQVGGGIIPVPVLHIDTSVKFEEIYQFIDKIARLWNFELISFRNEEALKNIKIAEDREFCCTHLKIIALNQAIEKFHFTALLAAVRWDENPARANEKFFSKRSNHIRVHPILSFTENDTWDYIKKYNLPYCSLYDKGYRSLGCKPCTKPAIEGDIERSGRSQDKEEIMIKLRNLGYF